jgi:hypothetical protein
MNFLLSIQFLTCWIVFGFLFFAPQSANCQARFTVSGQVKDGSNGENLSGANIQIKSLPIGTSTNSYGFYSLNLPEGEYVLIFSYVGYQPVEQVIILNQNLRIDIELLGQIDLGVVEVVAPSASGDIKLMDRVVVPIDKVESLPGLAGEKDVIKVLHLMPGVQRSREGASGFHVRGGGGDQNLIILDEAVVYNISHAFGFLSLFNGDAIKDVQVLKGGFPARYGGRLSSVLEITMKDGNQEKIAGDVGIGLVSSRLLLEGPLLKDRASFVFAGRRTYFDLLTKPFLSETDQLGYYFYDSNIKINFRINNNNRLFLSSYNGRDRFRNTESWKKHTESSDLYWQNQTFTLRWNKIINDRMFSNTSIIFSNYSMNLGYKETLRDEFSYKMNYLNGLRDWTFKQDLYLTPLPGHNVRMGAIATWHNFTPGSHSIQNTADSIDINHDMELNMLETAVYVEDEFRYNMMLFNAGLRLAHYRRSDDGKTFIEPRLSAGYIFPAGFTLKASYTQMNQAMHVLSSMGPGISVDLWLPAGQELQSQFSQQFALGIHKTLKKWQVELSAEAYLKKMDRMIAFRPGINFMTFNDPLLATDMVWADLLAQGKGTSRGIELMAQKRTGKLSGWISYALSKADLDFPELNSGKRFPASYDRRHDLSIVGVWRINSKVNISASWCYSSGNPFTIPVGTYKPYLPEDFKPDNELLFKGFRSIDYAESVNNFRMGAFHKLDVGIQLTKKKKNGFRTWDIGLYNAYNRKNPYYYSFRTNYDTGERYLKKSILLPIIPSVTYSRSF